MNKLQEKLKLYGWHGTLLVIVKTIIRKLTGFSWDKYYLMARVMDGLPSLPDKPFTVRKLTLADYENPSWTSFLDADKKRLYIERFANPNAKAYGAFVDGQLAFSSWIVGGELEIAEDLRIPMPDRCVLFMDTYCHPAYRGRGLHKFLIKWRLNHSSKIGAKKCYTIIHSCNKTSLKNQLKCGMEVERSFYVFRFGNNWGRKQWCTLKNSPV